MTPGPRSPLRLVLHQAKYEQKSYWRNPPSAFFTFAFPLMFLLIFGSLNAGNRLGNLPFNQFYVPGILAFGVISATYTNLAMTLTIRRDAGVLKRLRGTPLPAWALLAGLMTSCLLVSIVLSALVVGIGVLLFDFRVPPHLPAIAVALLLGVACFSAVGVAVTSLIRNSDAAPAVVNGLLFPVLFLSGVFYPLPAGSLISRVADLFPVSHFGRALFVAFDPRLPAGPLHGFAWPDLAVLAAWTVGASLLAVRTFRWTPTRR